MSNDVKHPMPASPLPWRTEIDSYEGHPDPNACQINVIAGSYEGRERVAVCEPEHSPLKAGGYGTTAKRNAAYILWAANTAPALAAEVARLKPLAITAEWQDSVRHAFVKAGVKPEDIDGAGSDGDEWAFTDAEIHQGINALVERTETAEAEVARLRAVTSALVAFKLWDVDRTRDNAIVLRDALKEIGLPSVALECSLGRIIDAAREAQKARQV